MAKFNLIFAFVPVLFIAALIFWESLASRVASLSSKVQQYQHLSRPSNTSSTSLQIIRHLAFLERIQNRESKLYSQNKEDGVIEYIFDNIGTTDKYYVEFGTENGNEINTRKLYEYYGWDGLLMDGGGKASDGRIIRNHIMDAENIVGLFQKYSVPHPTFDLLSVDLDFNDFFIAQSILLAGYTPNVLIVEYNRNWGPDESFTIRYDAKRRWNGDSYFGISALAAARLVKRFGYHTVYFDTNGVNMFAIKKSYLCDYIKRKIGYEITIDELEDYLPTFESVYRRSPPLHIQTAQEFNENKLKNDWIKVDEGGKALL